MDNFILAFVISGAISFAISFCTNFVKSFCDTAKKKSEKRDKVISTADELLKYKNLLDEGVITQEEFYQKKKQLLDKELQKTCLKNWEEFYV